MSVEFKFFKIVCPVALDELKQIRARKQVRQDAILELVKEFGAEYAREYRRGGIAYFSFPCGHSIDGRVWKKAHDGLYPKARTAEVEKIRALPPAEQFENVLSRWGLGGEMVLGAPVGPRGGFPMHSSHLLGDFGKQFFYIKVPYTGEYDKPTPEGLVEIKEWEALKGMDE